MNYKQILFLLFIALVINACNKNEPIDGDVVLYYSNNEILPEKAIAYDSVSGIKAMYSFPTSIYKHGILGDSIEGGGLMVIYNNKRYDFILDSTMVFEDIQPRLVDMDNDGFPEIITILTSITKGASVCVFQFKEEELKLLATTGFIGTPYRWLNIAAIDDLDNDGQIEIAFVSTPHIGGNLHIAQVDKEILKVYTQEPGVSNHQIGSRNLCLSAVTSSNGVKTLYLPNNDFSSILGYQWKNNELIGTDTISVTVDPLKTLVSQYQFIGLQANSNCISY